MEKLLAADEAIKFAETAARDFGESRLKIALQSAVVQPPTLVQRIDKRDEYYFIVSFAVASRDTARFMIDAVSGKLKQASGVVAADASLRRYVSSQDARDRMITARAASKVKKWAFEFRREFVGQHPVLVWKPCRQSGSPFLPFHQFSVGGSLVYLRVDGQLFQALTTGPV